MTSNYEKGLIFNNFQKRRFTPEEAHKCFQCFDFDHNGLINAKKIRKCFQSLGEEVTDEEIQEMISLCDDVCTVL